MKILVNCSNLKVGGGIQVALSFIHESIKFLSNDYCIVANEKVFDQIAIEKFPSNYKFMKFNYKFNRDSNLYLSKVENDFSPDIVFSIFGPTYWTPTSPHLMGFARGHTIYHKSLYRKYLNFKNRLFFDLKNNLLIYYTKKNSNNYVVETKSAQKVLSTMLPKNKKVYFVSNTYSSIYDTPSLWETIKMPLKNKNEFWFTYICANYPHKNISILPEVVSHLKKLDQKHQYKIILSINENQVDLSEEQKNNFIFLGKLNVNQCPPVYEAADALLMPSLIETFSASYLEAMKMQCPILTSDLDFAHDICKDAAIYFDPLNPKEIAAKILQLVSDNILREELINKGSERLLNFPTAKERAEQYLEICKIIVNETNNTRS